MNERYKKTNIVLGEGSFKTVSKAMDVEEGKEVAYNELRLKKYEQERQGATSITNEIAVLKNISHPNIIQILNYWNNDDNLIFITELMTGGTLKDYINKNGILSDKLIKKWGKQILEGILYLHSKNIIHRDIKAENIFVNASQGEIKIGDLGNTKDKQNKAFTMVGTLNFMSREIFEGEGYDETVDVYAFGMTLLQMATAKTPYCECADAAEVKKNVLAGIPPEALNFVENKCLRHLIIKCICTPMHRLSTQKCLTHHFFENKNECKKCLPNKVCLIYPLGSVKGMQLSMFTFIKNKISFLIQLKEKKNNDNCRFIKFEYDCENDTVEKICTELQKENVIEHEKIQMFSDLLLVGVEKAYEKLNQNEIENGFFKVTENESINKEYIIEKKEDKKTPVIIVEDVSTNKIVFKTDDNNGCKDDCAASTIEIMNEIENEMQQKSKESLMKKVKSSAENLLEENRDKEIETAAHIYQQYMHKSSSETLNTLDGVSYDIKDAYEITKNKYAEKLTIEEFTLDACIITQRESENAKVWCKTFKDEHILTTGDLKILEPMDWGKMNLTVFAVRTMQNMLYGHNGAKEFKPLRKQQDFPYSCPIEEYVRTICMDYDKLDYCEGWIKIFKNQEINVYGELRELTNEDLLRFRTDFKMSLLGLIILCQFK